MLAHVVIEAHDDLVTQADFHKLTGGSLEDFACDLVPKILEKHWRLAVASAQPEEIETSRGVVIPPA
ncbi:MAG: hypothetical protein ACKOBP_10310 [Planctomycetia bacterium]